MCLDALIAGRDHEVHEEKLFFKRASKETMMYTHSGGSFKMTFGDRRSRKSWDDLPAIKAEVFGGIINELSDIFEEKGPERFTAVFDLRKLHRRSDSEVDELLTKFVERYGKETRAAPEAGHLQGLQVVTPSIFADFGDDSEEEASDAFFSEWFNARKYLIDMSTTLKSEPVRVPQFLVDEDIPYLSDKTPVVLKHTDQTKCFSTFLREYGETYPRVAKAIRTMIMVPPNSSAIERGYAVMKEVISPKRCSLSERQAELCVLLACNLPNDLSKLPLMKIRQEMMKL